MIEYELHESLVAVAAITAQTSADTELKKEVECVNSNLGGAGSC